MSFTNSFATFWAVCVTLVAGTVTLVAGTVHGGEIPSNLHEGLSRWATFQEADQHLFALSIQPTQKYAYPRADNYELVVLFDTSASQTGWVRKEAFEVLDELVATLPAGTSVALMACDLDTVDLTGGLVSATDPAWELAVAKLKKRVPLGATNLSGALKAAAAEFTSQGSSSSQRTIIYIGDGLHRSNLLTSEEYRQLVDQLVESRVTVSCLAIGPVVDVANLATLANHTGGILYSRDAIEQSTQVIGRGLGLSVAMPVIWVEQLQLPPCVVSHFPQQFPPLRVDRDSVVVGKFGSSPVSGIVGLSGSVAGKKLELSWNVMPEESHPDMGFLISLVERASRDGGLNFPALGSEGLRTLSYTLADDAQSMIRSGEFALRSGQPDAAIRIAQEALKVDPENPEATVLLKAAQKANDSDQNTVPTGKLMQFGGQSPDDAGQSLLDDTLAAGDLLSQEQELRRASTQALQQHVRTQLSEARAAAAQDPIGVKNSLKLLLEVVDGSVDLPASDRSLLRDQIGSAIEQVAFQEAKFRQRIAQAETVRAQADAAERILNETKRTQDSLKQLVEHFTFLMSQQRYLEASKDVAPEIQDLAPDTPLAMIARDESSLMSNQALVMAAFKRREQGIIDAFRGVEEAAVPFDGNPPVLYPPPEIWQALSARRKERYASSSISADDDNTEHIHAALKQSFNDSLNYTDTPLSQIVNEIGEQFKVPAWINDAELDVEGIDRDEPVSLQIPAISLRSALRLILKPLGLTYIIRNEVLEITSEASVEDDPITRMYPVGDLVIPVMPMGGGMMGGGMMGGMGGGMGGMGGGMFAVPDDSSKSSSTSKSATASRSSLQQMDLQYWVSLFETASPDQTPELNTKVQDAVQGQLHLAEAFIEAQQTNKAQDAFQKIVDLVGGLLSEGYPQEWMFQALSLSMEACDYPKEEIKRVLFSAMDFGADAEKALEIAQYMSRKGMKAESLALLKDIAHQQPLRFDVFALALPIARELQDLDALKWVCAGVLGKAWPVEHANIFNDAWTLAQATQIRLSQEGRVLEATAFEELVKQSLRRDLIVRVNWTGHADVDIRVREPAGTVCSLSNPVTLGGGVLIGDTSSAGQKQELGGVSEYYVCPQGFSGQYDVLVRRVWGEVSGGKVTVEVYTDFGSPEQRVLSQQVDVSEKDALIQVAVKNGQRTQPLADAQLATVQAKQLATSRAVLGQLAMPGASSSGGSRSNPYSYFAFRQQQLRNGGFGFGFPGRGGAVGYQPVITTIPEGAMLFVSGVVSKDRRYVRLSPSPNFTGIGEIFTFNFVSGETGGGGAGGVGGGGLGGGGIGGGAGGLGGGGGGMF